MHLKILTVALVISAAITCPAQSPGPSATVTAASDFEELPELKASEILKPEILKGPNYTVREPVPTSSGMNQFTIDSEFGVFQADGNEMLLQRVKEIYMIAKLKDVSRTDQFEQSLVTAAKGPYNAAKNVVKDPANAVSSASKGLMKFMGRTEQTIKHVAKGETQKNTDGNKMEQMIGYTKAKSKIAVSMGIDPYSTNSVLQKELGDLAWASWAGGFTFSAATFPISGPVGATLTHDEYEQCDWRHCCLKNLRPNSRLSTVRLFATWEPAPKTRSVCSITRPLLQPSRPSLFSI